MTTTREGHHEARRTRIAGVPEPPPPLEKRPIRVIFMDRGNGTTKVQLEWGEWEHGVFQDFLWSEGILACDCMRLRLMYGEGEEWPCGSERVRVVITDTDGAPIYAEE